MDITPFSIDIDEETLFDLQTASATRAGLMRHQARRHFAAVEEPELLARDIAAFFAELGA